MTGAWFDRPEWHDEAACAGLPFAWFFEAREPAAGEGNDAWLRLAPDPPITAGQRAAAVDACRRCPVREACLLASLDRNEEAGRWGGAGEARRRALRRARATGDLAAALAAHWRLLDGAAEPGDRGLLVAFGAGATHGRASTYGKGCRGCPECSLAASLRVAADKRRSRARRTASPPSAA